MSSLALEGIRKSFGDREVLRGVDLRVEAGETIAILGANGSGKTTLLRVAATLSPPTRGHVHIGGMDTRRRGHAARARLGVAPQEPALVPELTCAEHIAWWARLHASTGLAPAETLQAMRDPRPALAAAGLEAQHDVRAGTLSRGQAQRLSLELAFLPRPDLLVLDEPFTGLDDASSARLKSRLEARWGNDATLLALHDARLAHELADAVYALRQGRLEAVHGS